MTTSVGGPDVKLVSQLSTVSGIKQELVVVSSCLEKVKNQVTSITNHLN